MPTMNLISIIVFAAIVAVGNVIKVYTRNRLKEMNGLGCIHYRMPEDQNDIFV